MQILNTTAVDPTRKHATDGTGSGTSSTGTTSGTSGTSSTGTTSDSTSLPDQLTSESTFLNLLVAQIQNQDPLNPTDSIQFVGQLVQFSQLEQLLSINQGVTTLASDVNPTAATSSTTGSTSGSTTSSINTPTDGSTNKIN
jgi:flagellar basal-body rod modification protein FlgD